MRTSWGLFARWSSQNVRGAVGTKSPLWHLSAEFYYCFDPDGCRDKRRSPFISYKGCNLISGQQNCHEQRRTLLFLFFFAFPLWLNYEFHIPHNSWYQSSSVAGVSTEHTQACWGDTTSPLSPAAACRRSELIVLCPWVLIQTLCGKKIAGTEHAFAALNMHYSFKR